MQTVITADVVNYDTTRKFDRVMSIEMFEHMKNYQVRKPVNTQPNTGEFKPLEFLAMAGY